MMKGKRDQRKKKIETPFFKNKSQGNQQVQASQNEHKTTNYFGKRPRKQAYTLYNVGDVRGITCIGSDLTKVKG
jgi:hypothetical protein